MAARRLHVADVQLRREAKGCRTADAQVLPRYPVAKSVLLHPAQDLAAQLVVALAGDHEVAVATGRPRKLAAVLLSPLHPDLALEAALLVALGLRRVQPATVKDLHALRMEELSCRDERVLRVYRPQTAQAIRVPHLPRCLPLLRVVAARRACLFHAQPATANRLTRAPVLHPDPRDRLYRALQAHPPDRDPRPLDLFLDRVPDCLPLARRRALAAGYSLDFPL
jgi:hypothetical protein